LSFKKLKTSTPDDNTIMVKWMIIAVAEPITTTPRTTTAARVIDLLPLLLQLLLL